MEPVPLNRLRLRPRDHKDALWWLALLYRRPKVFVDALSEFPHVDQAKVGVRLWLHAFPYILALAAIGRAVLLQLSGRPWRSPLFAPDIAIGIAGGIAVGIAFGIAGGIAGGIAIWIAGGIAVGIAVGIAFGSAVGSAVGIAGGIAIGIAVGIAVGIAEGIAFGIAVGIANGIASLRLYYHLIHPIFVWPTVRGAWYAKHPVAWDDICSVPFPRLDRLLVAYTEVDPSHGEPEIERLIATYPSQRTAALRARTILVAREAGRLTDLTQLPRITAALPEGEAAFLRQNRQVRGWLAEIAHQQFRFQTTDRHLLREPLALNLAQEIENFHHRLAGFEEPVQTEFRLAAKQWEIVARKQLEEVRRQLARQPVRQVFRAGDPVDRESEAFVLRDVVVGQLDQQVTLATGCPGVVLYARRRMGKSTLLRNLEGILPESVKPVTISLQDPTAFTSLEYFVARIAQALPAAAADASPRDLPGLHQRLEASNAFLKQENRRLLLALDEYEQIDVKIGEGVFPRDLLPAIRESIQSHRQITWLFAGSHEIDELPNAQWTSYLLSARTVEVPPFTLHETMQLLTEPLKHSQLWKTAEARPHFRPDFWGEGGMERIHAQADGWPHLLQLIAETTVDLLNTEGALAVTPALLERALDHAVTSGHIVLSQLMQGESTLPGEWEYLSAFRVRDEQPPPDDLAIRRSLRRRQIVREQDGLSRLRVPLMARWLRQRG